VLAIALRFGRGIVDFEDRPFAGGLGDETARATVALDQAGGGQLAQCLIHGHAGATVTLDQFTFRRHFVAGRPTAAQDLGLQFAANGGVT
jgi:hypothetical protein